MGRGGPPQAPSPGGHGQLCHQCLHSHWALYGASPAPACSPRLRGRGGSRKGPFGRSGRQSIGWDWGPLAPAAHSPSSPRLPTGVLGPGQQGLPVCLRSLSPGQHSSPICTRGPGFSPHLPDVGQSRERGHQVLPSSPPLPSAPHNPTPHPGLFSPHREQSTPHQGQEHLLPPGPPSPRPITALMPESPPPQFGVQSTNREQETQHPEPP